MQIILMALLGIVLAFLLVRFGPRSRREAEKPNEGMHNKRIGDGLRKLNANKKKYAVMTRALLDETPDDNLIEAVLSNLWAKMAPDLSDALAVMPEQTKERQYIFALYAVTGGIKQAGFEKLKDCPDAALLPVALEALQVLDMPQSAMLMQKGIEEEDADAYQEPYTDTFDGEAGKAKMIAYIRDHADAFCDLI